MFLRNLKESNYTDRNFIYVGSCVGALKEYDLTGENPYKPTNFQKISNLKLWQGITALKWADDGESEFIVGRKNSAIQVYNLPRNTFTVDTKIPGDGEVVGVCRVDEKLIGASSSGKIHILDRGTHGEISTSLETGTNIARMRQCRDNSKLLATGGKERKNNLKVWNIEEMKQIFSSKNVPHDSLQLEVPVWDSDMDFLDGNTLVTASRYGYIRTYDMRKQRRPVNEFLPKDDEHLSFSCLATYQNLVYVGLTTGGIRAFDTRSLKFPIHTYKGSIGSITDLALDRTGKYLCSSSLDRNVRINSTIDNTILYQCYVKTKPSRILIKSSNTENPSMDDEEQCKLVESSKHREVDEEDFSNDKLLMRLKRKRKSAN